MKTALITGAARGIGLATSKILVKKGWRVAILDRDGEELQKVAGNRDNIVAIKADVSDPEQVEAAARRLADEFGGLNALVNNAGVADFGPIRETSYDRWRTVMATNLDGPFLVSQACFDLLRKAKGSIVNITSISGLRASTLRVAYGTSKAALAHLTRQQAAEFGEFDIRVNAVAPGPVDTKLALAVHSPEIRQAYHEAIPLNRYGHEDEIANAIVFLVCDEASYITGQMIAVDGGFESTGIGLPALRNAIE